MKKNIIIAGVGGQGILTIATIIDMAAMHAGLKVKQAEVHGMSQRGGEVQTHLRISDSEIFSDLIPKGQADLILSVEPLEALRYLPYLAEEGSIVSCNEPFENIDNYPDHQHIIRLIAESASQSKFVDANSIAKDLGNPKSYNLVMLGAAIEHLGIDYSHFEWAVKKLFGKKGEAIVNLNIKALQACN